MATCTGQLLVGEPHPNDGGLYDTNELKFFENSRPSWQCKIRGQSHAWVPECVETMLPDGILMATILLVESDFLCHLVPTEWKNGSEFNLGSADPALLKKLREKLVSIDFCQKARIKFILNVFEDCSLKDFSFFEKMNCDVEILRPFYSRTKSQWDEEAIVKGEL